MKQIIPLFTLLIYCSCGGQSEKQTATQDRHTLVGDSIGNTIEAKTNLTKKTNPQNNLLQWEKHHDSLRNEILKRKENIMLRNSFLQEFYIRNVVSVLKDSLFMKIPFNLHGPDCGAPDCYSTDISFSFKLGDSLIFPKNIQFYEHEHGCIDKEKNLTGSFQLVEQTDRHVIYHSAKYKRTLVLFSSNAENGTSAFYFTQVGQHKINGKNVYNITEDYNEEDKQSIYPFTSWVLTTNEYGNFINK